MKVIKRNGQEVSFDSSKILNAVIKANNEVEQLDKMTNYDLLELVCETTKTCEDLNRAVSVEEIQNFVEETLMEMGYFEIARRYIKYRYERELVRKANTTDETILSLLDSTNEEIKQENSNKNPVIISTQRDYAAGEVSKDLTRRLLLPKDVVEAHDKGIIHFHDSDYFMQRSHNCDLINLEDMLQNGTVVSKTGIDKPHSFSTACNIATQIVAQVASCQYGGQTFTLTHLAPFVEVSRNKIKEEVTKEFYDMIQEDEIRTMPYTDTIDRIVEGRLKQEIKKGVQTIQYQINTLMTTNGQTPFVSVMMYLGEDPRYTKEVAMIIEEVLRQRIKGVKNEYGVYITPAFPKLLYVLEEQNIHKDSPYYYLTELAAECTAKRMVPDYISEKKMKELKIDSNGDGNCFPCINKACA